MTAPPTGDTQDSAPRREEQETIDSNFRGGSITAVGIIVGFTLSFLSSWATDPAKWSALDLVALLPLLVGVVLQLKSLADLLSVSSLVLRHYNRAKNTFLAGLILAALGIALAVTIGAVGWAR